MKPSFALFIGLFIAFYLAVHYYVLLRGCQALVNRPFLRISFMVIVIVCALALILGFAFENKLPIHWAYLTNVIGSSWLMALLYILLFVFFFDIVRFFENRFHFLDNTLSDHYTLAKNLIFLGITALVSLICLGGYVRFNNPSVVDYEVRLDKALPEEPIKIVVASDLHLGYSIREKRVRQFVEFINAQKPDLVLLCGDVIDRSFRPIEHQALQKELAKIQAPLGIYGVLGNHEYISQDISKVKDFYSKSNIRLLRDEAILMNDQYYIIGRDDLSNPNRKALDTLTKDLDRTKTWIVLDHQPSAVQESMDTKVDIQISGHTHDGQIWPINTLVKRLFPIHYGHKQFDTSHIIVTSGLGLWGGLFRIGTQSEIIVLKLI